MSIIPDKKHVVYSKEDNPLDERMDAIGKMLADREKVDTSKNKKPTVQDLRKELGLDGETI
ncbi:MAG: hypothetical protein ACR2KF_08585 [Nitrososphaeraceae archaeon]